MKTTLAILSLSVLASTANATTIEANANLNMYSETNAYVAAEAIKNAGFECNSISFMSKNSKSVIVSCDKYSKRYLLDYVDRKKDIFLVRESKKVMKSGVTMWTD